MSRSSTAFLVEAISLQDAASFPVRHCHDGAAFSRPFSFVGRMNSHHTSWRHAKSFVLSYRRPSHTMRGPLRPRCPTFSHVGFLWQSSMLRGRLRPVRAARKHGQDLRWEAPQHTCTP